jgi:hypothetical protein
MADIFKLQGSINVDTDKVVTSLKNMSKDVNNAGKSLENMESKTGKLDKILGGLGNTLSKTGKTLTLGITTPLVAAGTAAFKFASDYTESLNKVDVAFGNNANEIQDWSKTTLKNYGIAGGTALDMAAKYGDMATAMGLNTTQASSMAESLVGLGGDLSSFKNIKIDVADTALTSIFTGETESLKQLGIVMTQQNLNEFARQKGMKKTVEQMTQSEQVQLRYAYVMDKTKNAQGDFARTSDGAANQQRIFTESLKELSATFGQNLLPVFTPVIAKMNDLLQKFGGLDQGTQQSILKFGAFAIAIGPVLTVISKLSSGIGGTVKFVANLDKNFNKLKTTCSGAVTNLSKVGSAMTNGAKAAGTFALNVGKSAVELGKQAIQSAASVIKLTAHKIATMASTIATNALKIAQAALNFVMNLNPITKIILIIGSLIIAIKLLWDKCEWFRNGVTDVFNWITNKFKEFDDFLTGIFTTDWSNSFGIFGEYLNALLTNVSNIWNAIKEVFGGVIDFVAGVFTGDWSRAWQGVVEIFGGIMDGLEAVVKAPLNAVIGLINMAIDGLNSISVDIPSFVPGIGGQHFGVNLGKIDYLYTGGVFDEPTLLGGNTVVGDKYKGQGKQKEWVLPDELLRNTVAQVIREEISKIVIEMDGKEVARAQAKYQNEFKEYNIGRNPVLGY